LKNQKGDNAVKLYDSIGPNPRIVRIFMAEKSIEMPKQTVDLRGGENRQSDHLKRNPHGQMPALELDDGSYLSEITAICEYLEEMKPTPAMIGSTEGTRRMPDVDAPRRSQHLRADGEWLSLRPGREILRKTHSGGPRSVFGAEDGRRQSAGLARRPDDGRP
jgi:glutathione S-transferase